MLLKDEELAGTYDLRPKWWCFDCFVLASELPDGDGEIGRRCIQRCKCFFHCSDQEVVSLKGEPSASGDSTGAELLRLSELWACR